MAEKETISWKPGNIPYSSRYKDIYYSQEGGLEETSHTFLKPNQLKTRFQNDTQTTIVELGFGTGLNFLSTWKHWKEERAPGHRLNYFSVEKHPLQKEDIRKSLGVWPELSEITQRFLKHYRCYPEGFHPLILENGDLRLVLMIGEVRSCLKSFRGFADVWFLDGFAPRCNQEMWSEEVLQWVAYHSKMGTTFSTYTAVSKIRHDLEAAGFEVTKRKGFTPKRHMLTGTWKGAVLNRKFREPWFSLSGGTVAPRKAIIIGAGIAGISTARSLARRGWQIDLIDRHPEPAADASANPASMAMPIFAVQPIPLSNFSWTAYLFFIAEHQRLKEEGAENIGSLDGLIKIPKNEANWKRLQESIQNYPGSSEWVCNLEFDEVRNLAEQTESPVGLYFPEGGCLNMGNLCRSILELESSRSIYCRFETSVIGISRKENSWCVYDINEKRIAEAPVLILANAAGALEVKETSWFPLRKVRGQLSFVKGSKNSIHVPVAYDGYLTPLNDGDYVLGSTFDWNDLNLSYRKQEQDLMLKRARAVLPELDLKAMDPPQGWVGIRAASPDKLPMIGPVPDVEAFCSNYKDLHHGTPGREYPKAVHHPGLYCMLGLGSKGLTYSPLGAEILASQICSEPMPVESALVNALNPARILIRRLKRRI